MKIEHDTTKLQEAPDCFPGYYSEEQLARLRGRSLRTMARDRALGTGPAWTKIGNRILYRQAAVEAWLLAHEHRPVREDKARPSKPAAPR